MKTARTIHLLLLTDDPAKRQRWADWLQPLPGLVFADPSRDPAEPLDLIVTDRASVADCLRGADRRLTSGEIGVISIGRAGPADVSLPADVTRRELELACRLLHEIVRLRRQRRARRRQADQLLQLSLTDPLTGLPNRRGWDRQLAAALHQPCPSNSSLCLAIFDLDHFKAVNDDHGHACGDAVLRAAAQALADGVRHGDLAARLGGDEFALAFFSSQLDAAHRVVERVRQAVACRVADAGLPAVTASAGFSLASDDTDDLPKTLFQTADAALRRAKHSGRNASVFQPVPPN